MRGYFVNEAMEEAIKAYIVSEKTSSGVIYNSFLVVVIRILVLIYGKTDILNSYYAKDNVAFINLLAKYGMSKTDIALFKEEFLSYYKFEKDNEKRAFKVENPYFKSTLKYLVDMFVAKKSQGEVVLAEEEKFLELAYTTHTKDYYQISYNCLMKNDPVYFEKYYYSKINELDVTRDFKTISALNLDALDCMGVGLSKLANMDNQEIEKAKMEAYRYFEVDGFSPSRDEDLQEAVNYYKKYGNKVSPANGYVGILLLMSVVSTILSVLVIIFFSFI